MTGLAIARDVIARVRTAVLVAVADALVFYSPLTLRVLEEVRKRPGGRAVDYARTISGADIGEVRGRLVALHVRGLLSSTERGDLPTLWHPRGSRCS